MVLALLLESDWRKHNKHVEALIWSFCLFLGFFVYRLYIYIHLAFNPLCSFQLPSFWSLIIRSPIVNGKDTWQPKRVGMSNGEVHTCTWMGMGPTSVVGGSLRLMIVFSTTSVPPVLLCFSLHALCCPPLHTFPCHNVPMTPSWGPTFSLFSSQNKTLSGILGPTQFQQIFFFFFFSFLFFFSPSSSKLILIQSNLHSKTFIFNQTGIHYCCSAASCLPHTNLLFNFQTDFMFYIYIYIYIYIYMQYLPWIVFIHFGAQFNHASMCTRVLQNSNIMHPNVDLIKLLASY